MTAWSIEQMRQAVNETGWFVADGDRGEVCDYLELTEEEQQEIEPPRGIIVDIQTANLLVTVHDALTEPNRTTFLAMSLERAVSIAWRLVTPKAEARS